MPAGSSAGPGTIRRARSPRPPQRSPAARGATGRRPAAASRGETESRLSYLRRVHDALRRLEAARSVDVLLPMAAEELAAACRFDRTVISRRRGETWRAEAVWISPALDPAISAATERYLRETWIPIGPKALEADLIRRRTADLVMAGDPRTTPERKRVQDPWQLAAIFLIFPITFVGVNYGGGMAMIVGLHAKNTNEFIRYTTTLLSMGCAVLIVRLAASFLPDTVATRSTAPTGADSDTPAPRPQREAVAAD